VERAFCHYKLICQMIACLVLYRRRAALGQSGGSTPPPNLHMFEMRVRIMTAPTFTGAKVIAAILFEGAMDDQAQEKPVPAFTQCWRARDGP
jgi:fructose-bisphosphate aldolase class 1